MVEASGTNTIGHNVRGLLTQAERLARTEVELAIEKGRASVSETVRNMGMLVAAGVFALGGLAYLLHAVYSGLATRVDSWLAALLTAVAAFISAFVLMRLGVSKGATADESDAIVDHRTSAVAAR